MATKKGYTHDKDDLISQAIKELGIDVPVMATRFVGNRLELHLYGGEVKKVELEEDPYPDPEQSGQVLDDGSNKVKKTSRKRSK